MSKFRLVNIAISIISFLLALLIFLIAITEANNIQIIELQPLYFILDREGLLPRSILFLLISIGATTFLFRFNKRDIRDRVFYSLFIIVPEIILTLLVFYGHSCCDTPVSLYFGFPLSWLWGATLTQHYLSEPILAYLVANLFNIQWQILILNFIGDILFWYNINFLVLAFWRSRRPMTEAHQGLLNIYQNK